MCRRLKVEHMETEKNVHQQEQQQERRECVVCKADSRSQQKDNIRLNAED